MIWRGKRTHYDRVEIEFGWIEEPADDEVAARSGEGHAFEVAKKMRAERLDAFFGRPVASDPLLSARRAPKDALWIPHEGFPINWSSARIVRKFVEADPREETQDVADRLKAFGDVAADHPEANRLRTLQRELAALKWTVGEMGPLQYWITPEDLAAKRFENTVLTIEAY